MTELASPSSAPHPAARASSAGSGRTRGGSARSAALLGPALVAGVAYLDPGNVAANLTAGATFGFLLVWVIVIANPMAWLVQYLSAKLGLVTGRSLAEHVGTGLRSRWSRRLFWLQAQGVAMATDLAEVTGGAIALALLFDLPLPLGGVITAAVSVVLLSANGRGRERQFERVVAAMVIVIVVGFGAGLVLDPPSVGSVAGGLLPRFDGPASVLLAASIMGATVMPHAIYAHSALTRDRFRAVPRAAVRRLITITRVDVTLALTVAGSVNLALLLFAAQSLFAVPGTDSLPGAYAAVQQSMGLTVATVFAVGLLVSGLASTAVGAYAGADVLGGLLQVRWPVLVRRLVSVVPALLVLASGFDPTQALVLSQVILSFGIPFAVVPLLWLTSRADLMGEFRNRRATVALGVIVAGTLIGLNITLLVLVVA